MNEYYEKKSYIRYGIRKEVREIKIPKVKWINIWKKKEEIKAILEISRIV